MAEKNRHAQCIFVRNRQVVCERTSVTRGGKGSIIPRTPNHCGGAPDDCRGRR